MLAMKHGFLITSVDMLQTAQNFTCFITMETIRHLSLLWGVVICRCHGNTMLDMKHDVVITQKNNPNGPRFHMMVNGFGPQHVHDTLVSFPQKPFAWKHILAMKYNLAITPV